MGLGGTINRMAGDRSVVAAGPPVENELVESVVLVFVGMLFPVRIVVIDAVGLFVVLLFDRLEELIDDFLFRVVPEDEIQHGGDDDDNQSDQDNPVAPLRRPGIIFRSI